MKTKWHKAIDVHLLRKIQGCESTLVVRVPAWSPTVGKSFVETSIKHKEALVDSIIPASYPGWEITRLVQLFTQADPT